MSSAPALSRNIFGLTVAITGLGYFIDMYDLFLFNVTRAPSLTELGLSGDKLVTTGANILYLQIAGLLLGSFIWGTLADKMGRKTCLFISIFLYSATTFACGLVQQVEHYMLLRFIAGFALSGEVGIGITLISEHLQAGRRGMGVALFAAMGFCGILVAGLVSELVGWRDAYLWGGGLGFALLLARTLLPESLIYTEAKKKNTLQGDLRLIFTNAALRKRYICSILAAAPVAYCVLLYTFAPEIARGMSIEEPVKSTIASGVFQTFLIASDIIGAFVSDKIKNRKKVIGIFQLSGLAVLIVFLLWPKSSALDYYIFSGAFGLSLGSWVLLYTMSAEQFGTNIRGVAATTIPNFARATIVPITFAFNELRHIDVIFAVGLVGFFVLFLAIAALKGLEETYQKDLSYSDKRVA